MFYGVFLIARYEQRGAALTRGGGGVLVCEKFITLGKV